MVFSDWRPTSGYIHWPSPYAAVQEPFNCGHRSRLRWNPVKHWKKWVEIPHLEIFCRSRNETRDVFFRKRSRKKFQRLWWDNSLNFFLLRLIFLRWHLHPFFTLAFLSSWLHYWLFTVRNDLQEFDGAIVKNPWCNQLKRNANVKKGRKGCCSMSAKPAGENQEIPGPFTKKMRLTKHWILYLSIY